MLERSLLAAALLLSVGCAARDKASTEQEARTVADAHMRGFLSGDSIKQMRVSAIDMEDRWRFYYGGGTGGFLIVVNKHSGEVVHSEAQQ